LSEVVKEAQREEKKNDSVELTSSSVGREIIEELPSYQNGGNV
jgi:hypothetical protein